VSLFNELCCGCAPSPAADGPSPIVQRPSQRIEPIDPDTGDELDADDTST